MGAEVGKGGGGGGGEKIEELFFLFSSVTQTLMGANET